MSFPGGYRLLVMAARLYRRGLARVVFIGITGSGGKTTTKELIARVLSRRMSGQRSQGTLNEFGELAKTILATRPWHRFCVQEISVGNVGPGTVRRTLELVRPRIGVVTNVGGDHISAFGSLEAIAAEKGELIAALPPDGTAVLNADDPLVLQMAGRCAGQVITYGRGEQAMVRAEEVRSAWPERLSLTVRCEGRTARVQTRLCGAFWVSSVLAAVATGIAMGVPLEEAAEAIASMDPFPGRMCPVVRADGVVFIADHWKASLWTVAPALAFVKEARASRKIVVLGTLADYRGDSGRKYVQVAREALDAADHVIFVGPWASRCLRAKRHPDDDALRAFDDVHGAGAYLRTFLRPGDLVLVKGSHMADNLRRLVTDLVASGDAEPLPAGRPLASRAHTSGGPATVEGAHPTRVVVGFGNAGARFDGTPHNVGWQVLDVLAGTLGARWEARDEAQVAQVRQPGMTVYLVKPSINVNTTGQALARLGQRLDVNPGSHILVHDDINLALGVVRERARGSDGGHKGVRSVLQTFQTDAIARVKVGVGRPDDTAKLAEYVLTPFGPLDREKVELACAEAADRVVHLLTVKRG